MPYSLNLVDKISEQPDFSAQILPANTTRPVSILFNGSGLHTISGPVPFVDISKSFNRTAGGEIENILNTITLTGKIIRPDITPPPTSGIQTVMTAITGLQSLFSKCSTGHLIVRCDNTDMLNVSGVMVKDISINKSEDNWVFSADYTITMEYYEPAVSGGIAVQNTSDSWSIEPIDDYVHSSFTDAVNTKTEHHNPQLKPTPIPGGGAGGGGGNLGGVGSSTSLKVINIPQYRISRRLSAVGVPKSEPASSANITCVSGGGNRAYMEARKWVESRLEYTFEGTKVGSNTSGTSGLVHIMTTPAIGNFKDTFLYNHVRSINFSITDGSYEINDTWLAMPTGIKYVEDYSVESSTDEKYVKTVRVQGSIKGLYISSFEVMKGSGGVGLPPTGAGYLNIVPNSGRASGALPGAGNILDLNPTSAGSQSTFYENPYQNASSGWIFDIKPYLYRRASLAVYNNRHDRNQNYISPATNPAPPPNNPMYCHEALLNTIPTTTTEGHDPRKGTISYSYEFNNKFNMITGVISENISMTETGPTDVFSEAFVIGRQLGPIIQSLGTKTSTRKDLTVEVVVLPPSSIAGLIMTNSQCPLFTGGSVYGHIQGIVDGLKPFGARAGAYFGNISRGQMPGQVYLSQDNHSWNPTEGRYSRSVSWVYQQCSTDKLYLDH
jgi:hypothetical protein